MQTFLVQCPQCKQRMKFLPIKADTIFRKKKKCVYCGRSFSVRENVVQ